MGSVREAAFFGGESAVQGIFLWDEKWLPWDEPGHPSIISEGPESFLCTGRASSFLLQQPGSLWHREPAGGREPYTLRNMISFLAH